MLIVGSGLGLLVSQLNNYTLSPIEEERVSEAAGVNSAAGSFGLSFGLAMAGGIMLAFLAFDFTRLVNDSSVIPPAQQQQISKTLEHDAEIMSNSQLEPLLVKEPKDIQAEILSINKQARDRSLQVALLVPILRRPLGAAQRVPDETPPRPGACQLDRRRGARLSTPSRRVTFESKCCRLFQECVLSLPTRPPG